jgi:hypothetical protein
MRRKIAISLGILLTILYPTVFFLFGKKSVQIVRWISNYEEEKSRKWNCLRTVFLFDKDERLYEVQFYPPFEGEFLGFRQNDDLKKIIAKWGKPSKAYDFATSYNNRITKCKALIYQREGGEISFHFASDIWGTYGLEYIKFHKVNPDIPKGVRMGMKKEELERILGTPNFSVPEKKARMLPILFLFSLFAVSFWTAFLVNSLPRGKDLAHKISFFLFSTLIALAFLACVWTSLNLIKLFLIKPPISVNALQLSLGAFLFGCRFMLIPSILLGGLFTWLEYGARVKLVWQISVIVLIAVFFSLLMSFSSQPLNITNFPPSLKARVFTAFKDILSPLNSLFFYPFLLLIWFSSLRSNQSET